jgi:hypothetical protein
VGLPLYLASWAVLTVHRALGNHKASNEAKYNALKLLNDGTGGDIPPHCLSENTGGRNETLSGTNACFTRWGSRYFIKEFPFLTSTI